MIDPVSLFIGAGLLTSGVLIGRVMRPKPPGPPALVCSCGDGYGQHAEDGHCLAEVRRLRDGCNTVYDWVPCSCRVYDGPEPLPRVWQGNSPL